MFLVLLMLFDPGRGWSRAVESGRSIVRVLCLHLIPLLLLGCVAEGAGMMRWGKPAGLAGTLRTYPLGQVVRYQACHLVVALALVLLCAVFVRVIANTFQARQTLGQALTATVFGL